MAAILNSRAKFYQNGSRENCDADYRIESEADIFIKELSIKQRDTNITLEGQLNQRKDFKSSHTYQPVTELTSGSVSCEEFKKISSETDRSSQNDSSRDELGAPSKRNVSRHVQELALSVKPNSVETKLLKFAISCRTIGEVQNDNRPADHPINKLDDIQDELFGHHSFLNNPQKTAKTILRKRKQLLETASEPVEIRKEHEIVKAKSLWDRRESDVQKVLPKPKVYTCKRQKLFTIRDGKIMEITNENESIQNEELETTNDSPNSPSSENTTGRLSVEEIKNIPKFQNYDKGRPSEVLYLKNLSANVTDEDITSLFANYQRGDKPCITYNLMKKGKMRGQAFINFHCLEAASQALDEINGTILHGKPVIVQFSSRKG